MQCVAETSILQWQHLGVRCERAGTAAGGGGKVFRLSEGMSREAARRRQRPVLPAHSTLKYHISDAEHLMSRD